LQFLQALPQKLQTTVILLVVAVAAAAAQVTTPPRMELLLLAAAVAAAVPILVYPVRQAPVHFKPVQPASREH
jgi:hypothetical protein